MENNSKHFIHMREGTWDIIDRTHYRITIDHEQKIINFTGQESSDEDWPDNFDFRVRAIQWFSDNDQIWVHAGFLRQYMAVRNKWLDTAYEYPDYSIRVDGFSLGGSWTQIFVQDVLHHWPDRDILAIFYAPGNPWRKLPKEYQIALKQCTIFVRSIWDPVTWMRAIRFYRYGRHYTVGKWYRIFPLQHRPEQIIRGLDGLNYKTSSNFLHDLLLFEHGKRQKTGF